jgi:hypothetical protein
MHPYTFKRFDSYLEIFRKPGASSIDLSFQMRTFEPNGILFYTNLSEPRNLMIGINDVPDQDFLRVRKEIYSKLIIQRFLFSFFLMKDS